MTPREEEYGQFQDDTSWYAHAGHREAGELVYLALGLVGEAGEFADAIKKVVRETGCTNVAAFDDVMQRVGTREKLIDELGDTLWYLNKLMRFLGVNHADLMALNTLKLYSRLSARPKANIMELEWPFKDNTYQEYHAMYKHLLLARDKDHDGV